VDHNRSRVEIIDQILESAKGGGTTKTKIICNALLSYKQLNEYLIILIESDLLRYDDQTHTFKTTEKGLGFLNFYNEICDVIKELPQPQQQ
jgi:predicted transcriptional regulator